LVLPAINDHRAHLVLKGQQLTVSLDNLVLRETRGPLVMLEHLGSQEMLDLLVRQDKLVCLETLALLDKPVSLVNRAYLEAKDRRVRLDSLAQPVSRDHPDPRELQDLRDQVVVPVRQEAMET